MRRIASQAGFSIVETLVVIVVLAALGFVGYKVYQHQHDNTNSTPTVSKQTSTEESSTAGDVAKAPNVNSTSDLDKAAAALDQTDPAGSNNSDGSQLSSQADSF